MILLHLPLPDILLAQRVNRTWNGVIKASVKLQQALFFKPVCEDKLVFTKEYLTYADCINFAECKRSIPTISDGSAVVPGYWTSNSNASRPSKIALNPFVYNKFPSLVNGVDRGNFWDGQLETHALRRPEASWRAMLFTQSPLEDLLYDHGIAFHWHIVRSSTERGLTIGDMVDSSQQFYRKGRNYRIILNKEDIHNFHETLRCKEEFDASASDVLKTIEQILIRNRRKEE